VRAAQPGSSTSELFTTPAGRGKDALQPGAAPRPASAGDSQPVANIGPPVPPPAVPLPVAPKPPSLEAPLDPAAMAGRSGPEAVGRGRTTRPVTVRVPLGGRPGDAPAVTVPASVPPAPMPPPAPVPPAPAAPSGPFPTAPSASWEATPAGWAGSAGWPAEPDPMQGPGGPVAVDDPAAGGPATAAWPGVGDPGQPATTIVPGRGKGARKVPGRSKPGRVAGEDHLVAEPDGGPMPAELREAERSRLVSLMVFWAPALILLFLAALVVWVVR
jgi:hypothetical protein